MPGRYRHAPGSSAECQRCHSAHGSKFPKNTLAEAGELCMRATTPRRRAACAHPRGNMLIDMKKPTCTR